MLLELAVVTDVSHIVTHNLRHFASAESFGVCALAPAALLRLVGLRP